MSDETKTVYCMDSRPADNSALWAALMSGKQESPAELATLLNNNNMMNNPFFYLIFLMLFRNGGLWGNNDGAAIAANADVNRLSAQVADNNNTQLLRDAISGNGSAISTLAANLNCDFNALNGAICSVKSAVDNVAGQVGFSAERVINAANMGDASIIAKLQECCCNNRTAILEQTNTLSAQAANNFASSQLQACKDNGAVLGRVDQLANGVQQGFATIGYQMAANKGDIINAGNANTQRIIDTLNCHWQSELQQKYADARLELSQKTQNEYLLAQLKTTA